MVQTSGMSDSYTSSLSLGSAEAVLHQMAAIIQQDYMSGSALDHRTFFGTREMCDLEFVRVEIPPGQRLDGPLAGDPEFTADPSWGAEAIQEAAEGVTPLILWLKHEDPDGQDPVSFAVTVILESARTTALAIALLVRHGYLADAEARWRGLYEITAQLALISSAGRRPEAELETVATAYLVHSGLWDSAKLSLKVSQQILPPKDFSWLQAAGGEWGSKGRISQAAVLREADLTVPPDREQLHHGSVHMSSGIAAAGGIASGFAPAGASLKRARRVAQRVLLTLDDLVAHAALAITHETGSDRPEVFYHSVDFHQRIMGLEAAQS